MAHSQDYIPKKDALFGPWADNLITYAQANATRLSIPSLAFSVLTIYYASWVTDFEQSQAANHTAADIVKKNTTRHMLEANLRNFVNQYIRYNPAVTDADLAGMGLPIPDPARTPIPRPTTAPVHTVESKGILQVLLRFHFVDSQNEAIPYGYDGAVISYAVSSEPTADYPDLTTTALATKTRFHMEFPPEDRGKWLHTALQWQNDKGKRGPWSDIQSAVIP
jgi:hypothetical protein